MRKDRIQTQTQWQLPRAIQYGIQITFQRDGKRANYLIHRARISIQSFGGGEILPHHLVNKNVKKQKCVPNSIKENTVSYD